MESNVSNASDRSSFLGPPGSASASVVAARGLRGKVARVADIFEALLAAPPEAEQWPEWLARATALLSQYENVLRELRPTLGRFMLIPGEVGSNNEHIPNVLLRTRLLPDVETHLATLNAPLETGGMLKILAQLLQESADTLRASARPIPATIPTEDEALVQAVRSRYGVCHQGGNPCIAR